MKNKKGISLITLIVTIVVIVILAGAIIINLVKTNIIENAEEAVELNDKSVTKEEVRLSTYDLALKEETTEMTQEDIRTELEEKLKAYDANSKVVLNGTGFRATHRGQVFEISERFKIKVVSQEEVNKELEREKWDSDTKDEYFRWDSTGTVIVGFTDKIDGCQKLRIPTKCVAIVPDTLWTSNFSRLQLTNDVKKIEIPGTVTKIGDSAFSYFSALEEVEIQNGVKEIGNSVFYLCTKLKSISFPDSVTSMGSFMFSQCYNLTNVKLPNGITTIEDSTFSSCSKLTNLTIPNSVTSIGNGAFSSCSSLTNLTIPRDVTSIGEYAFSDCTGLTSIIIPEKVTSMGYRVFYGWDTTKYVYCEADAKPDGWDEKWYGSVSIDTEEHVNIEWGYTVE